MKEMSFLNNEWLHRLTGDPFADTGGFVIEYLQTIKPNSSIIELIEYITNIYVNKWDNNLHSFFLNSTITHNSNKGQKGINKTIAYYKGLLDNKDSVDGVCRITGQRGKVFFGARENHIMSGSATLINFHHGFESGIHLSKEVLIRMLFLPLGVEQLGDKIAIVTSNNADVMRYFVRKNVNNNLKDLASGISGSVQKSEHSNPTNALFDYVSQCVENLKTVTYNNETDKSETKGIVLNLFHFTNFGAKPTINIYTIPAIVFDYYAFCIVNYKNEWNGFINYYYHYSKFKDAKYNEELGVWYNSKESVNYQIYKVWKNTVFEYLLNGKTILPLFLRYCKSHHLNFKIVELYQINIKCMDKRSLVKIKEMAVFIVKDRSDDEIKKAMTRLNGAKNSNDLRFFLLKLLNKNYEEGNKEPLFSLDEYVEYLFPDGAYWKEIRDLLLIAVFEKLHEVNKLLELDLPDNNSEE